MTTKEKIKKYIDCKGISKNKFYTITGFSSTFLDSGNTIGVDKAKIIIESFPDLSLEWLVLDRGPMLKPQEGEPQQQIASTAITKIYPAQELIAEQSVPYYDMPKKATIAALFDGKMKLRDFLYIPDLPPCDGAIMMEGAQMAPELKQGDVILYKKVKDLKKGLFWGHIYLLAFEVDGEEHIMVKYIQPSEDAKCVKLVSENKEFAARDIPIEAITGAAIVRASLRYRAI